MCHSGKAKNLKIARSYLNTAASTLRYAGVNNKVAEK